MPISAQHAYVDFNSKSETGGFRFPQIAASAGQATAVMDADDDLWTLSEHTVRQDAPGVSPTGRSIASFPAADAQGDSAARAAPGGAIVSDSATDGESGDASEGALAGMSENQREVVSVMAQLAEDAARLDPAAVAASLEFVRAALRAARVSLRPAGFF